MGKDVLNNDLRYLEFLANRYGNGEEEQIPRIAAELISPSFPKLRMATMNIGGVGEIRRVARLIDHYHSLQTIVFVVLDNENNAAAAQSKLCRTRSRCNHGRTITKGDYFHIWEKNIEVDNFTDEEVANVLTLIAEHRAVFIAAEIATCRASFGGGSDQISKLYATKVNYGLQKPKLLKMLFDFAITHPEMQLGDRVVRRPVFDLVIKIQRLALRNQQPSHLDAWKQTQDSDWLVDRLT
jgi:hypothetical protein